MTTPDAPNAFSPDRGREVWAGFRLGALLHICWYGLGSALVVERVVQGRVDAMAGVGVAALAAGLLTTAIVFITSVVMLLVPSRRLFGAGMLMAWAIGLIVGSGVCVAVLNAGF